MEIGPYGWLSGPVERRHLNVLATSRRTNRHSRCRISNARRRDGATTVRATFFIRRGHISGPIELSSSPPAPPVRRLAGRYKAVERRPASLVSPARPGPGRGGLCAADFPPGSAECGVFFSGTPNRRGAVPGCCARIKAAS